MREPHTESRTWWWLCLGLLSPGRSSGGAPSQRGSLMSQPAAALGLEEKSTRHMQRLSSPLYSILGPEAEPLLLLLALGLELSSPTPTTPCYMPPGLAAQPPRSTQPLPRASIALPPALVPQGAWHRGG